MMEEILITDANIIFDLFAADLLHEFFLLPNPIKTTEFVINEIKDIQQRALIDTYISTGRLGIYVFKPEDFSLIQELKNDLPGNLSFEDCSVLLCAINSKEPMVLSGDLSLRKNASAHGLKVKGVIGVMDMMIKCHITHAEIAARKLQKLMSINTWLPKGKCLEAIKRWSSGDLG